MRGWRRRHDSGRGGESRGRGLCGGGGGAAGAARRVARGDGDARWFASTQIRNAAARRQPRHRIADFDMNPMLAACGATLRVASPRAATAPSPSPSSRHRTVDPAADEIVSPSTCRTPTRTLSSVPSSRRAAARTPAPPLPPVPGLTPASPHSQARRREDDISIVTAGIHVRLTPTDGAWWRRRRSRLAGWRRRWSSPKAAAALVGGLRDEATVGTACADGRAAPPSALGAPEYRTALAASFLFKFFVATAIDLADAAPRRRRRSSPPPSAPPRGRSSSSPSTRGAPALPARVLPGPRGGRRTGITAAGETEAAKAGGVRVVGESLPHAAGALHTTGSAVHGRRAAAAGHPPRLARARDAGARHRHRHRCDGGTPPTASPPFSSSTTFRRAARIRLGPS